MQSGLWLALALALCVPGPLAEEPPGSGTATRVLFSPGGEEAGAPDEIKASPPRQSVILAWEFTKINTGYSSSLETYLFNIDLTFVISVGGWLGSGNKTI